MAEHVRPANNRLTEPPHHGSPPTQQKKTPASAGVFLLARFIRSRSHEESCSAQNDTQRFSLPIQNRRVSVRKNNCPPAATIADRTTLSSLVPKFA